MNESGLFFLNDFGELILSIIGVIVCFAIFWYLLVFPPTKNISDEEYKQKKLSLLKKKEELKKAS
ncbi:MAG: hypothetical protein PHI53_00925 [Candidatus Pacebacteria bacterium]|nr:hypothetical protein [Candidatus Paceibacterota bacterium]